MIGQALRRSVLISLIVSLDIVSMTYIDVYIHLSDLEGCLCHRILV